MSFVYLLHFDRRINPNRPAQHYLGFTTDIDKRLKQHRKGNGARLTQVAKEQGIGFQLATVIEGDYALEQKLKRRRHHPRLCPICKQKKSQPF